MKKFPEFYGLATVGERGQVVIPAKARAALKIKPGDKLIVMAAHPGEKKMITLISAEDFARFLKGFEAQIATVKKQLSEKGK